MNRDDKRGIFFGVVGVLTLIVAIIGASLAYFSINARSADDAITVQAATLKIEYLDGGQKLAVSNIIPTRKTVAETTYQRYLNGDKYHDDTLDQDVAYDKCVDDNGHNVCGVYHFVITNNGPAETETPIKMTIVPTELKDKEGNTVTDYKKFKNLKYALYEIPYDAEAGTTALEQANAYKSGLGTLVKSENIASEYTEGNDTVTVTAYKNTEILTYNADEPESNTTIPGQTTKIYRLFVWLDEVSSEGTLDVAQDYEQGAIFQGAVSIEVGGTGSQVTGTVNQGQ